MPRLSILLSAYNCEKYIGYAIENILNQTFVDFELIIADDGSTDKTKEKIDAFLDPRIIKTHNVVNLGKTATINRLQKMIAKEAEFVTIHDADDISEKERFFKQIEYLDKMPEIGLLGTSFECIYADGSHFSELKMPKDVAEIDLQKQSMFHGPTVVFRKSLLQLEEKLYRDFFRSHNEDCDLMHRLFERSGGENLEEILYRYRILPNALSKVLSPRKKVMYQIVALLARQRKEFGRDQIEEDKEKELELFIEDLTIEYQKDKSKIFREQASWYMYYGLRKEAIGSSLQAIKTEPLKFENWRTFQYCFRKAIFRF